MRAAMYLRVSKADQTTENQRLELERIAETRGWQVVETYTDHGISGARFGKDRPALERLRKDAVRRKFDVVMAWSIDRIGRSTFEVTGFMREMDALSVGQFYAQQSVDTTTPTGKAMVHMAVVFAEFERDMITQRIRAGIARARRQGTRSGKPIGRPTVAPAVLDRVRRERAKGLSVRKIAEKVGLSIGRVHQAIAASA